MYSASTYFTDVWKKNVLTTMKTVVVVKHAISNEMRHNIYFHYKLRKNMSSAFCNLFTKCIHEYKMHPTILLPTVYDTANYIIILCMQF